MMKVSLVKQAKASVLTINGGSSSIKFALFDADHKLRRSTEVHITSTRVLCAI